MDHTLRYRLKSQVNLLLDPDLFLELATQHQKLFQENVVPFIGDLEIEVTFQAPIEGVSNNVGVMKRSLYQHFSKW